MALHNRLAAIEAKNIDIDENLATEFVVPQATPITKLIQSADPPHNVSIAPLHNRQSSSSDTDWEPVLSSSVGSRMNTAVTRENDSNNSIDNSSDNENFHRRQKESMSKRRNMLDTELVGSLNNVLKRRKF